MANTKISALTGATTPLAGTEILPIVQSSTTKQVSVADLTAGRVISASGGTFKSTGAYGTVSVDNTGTTGGGGFSVRQNGTTMGAVGVSGYIRGDTSTNLALFSETGKSIEIFVNGSATAVGSFSTAGNYTPAAAKGINFTGNTPAAGMTSQLLNWYEEGTWTPVPTSSIGSITSYTSSGRYTRIGRAVVLSFKITITNNGTGLGVLFATGMPFAASAVNLESGTIAEVAVVGFSGYTVFNTTTKLSMGKYDNTYAGGTNYVIVGQITYQI